MSFTVTEQITISLRCRSRLALRSAPPRNVGTGESALGENCPQTQARRPAAQRGSQASAGRRWLVALSLGYGAELACIAQAVALCCAREVFKTEKPGCGSAGPAGRIGWHGAGQSQNTRASAHRWQSRCFGALGRSRQKSRDGQIKKSSFFQFRSESLVFIG